MKALFITLILLIMIAVDIRAQDSTKSTDSPAEQNQFFVDEDGDGYNDNAPDHDGDGIPNGLDPDWIKLKKEKEKKRFIDLDGDGINDNFQTTGSPGKGDGEQMGEKDASLNDSEKNQKGRRQLQRGKK